MSHMIVWLIYSLPFIVVAVFVRWRLRLARRRVDRCCHREAYDLALFRNQMAQDRLERLAGECPKAE